VYWDGCHCHWCSRDAEGKEEESGRELVRKDHYRGVVSLNVKRYVCGVERKVQTQNRGDESGL
jgi:hypothetical protein